MEKWNFFMICTFLANGLENYLCDMVGCLFNDIVLLNKHTVEQFVLTPL